MTLTLSEARTRLLARLGDPDGAIYTSAGLDEALRRSLALINKAAGSLGWTLAGLDTAAETSLPAGETEPLLGGAAWAGVTARCLSRAGEVDLTPDLFTQLKGLAGELWLAFERDLEAVRAARLAAALPYGTEFGWDELE